MTYYVVVHGGAGSHPNESEKEIKRALRRACTRALELLQNGKKSVEAVECAITELEDSECLNAGYGSNLTNEGTVECDAAIMEDSGKFGSVGAVSGIKNPIRAAKAVLDHSARKEPLGLVPPITLVSDGARSFASAFNVATIRPDDMVSPRAKKEWKYWTAKAKASIPDEAGYPETASGERETVMQDTVGAVALDMSGNLAAGVSSGGLLLKWPGRVGEAAMFGAGCWASDSPDGGVASSVSGTGEAIMRVSLARVLCEVMCLENPEKKLQDILTNQISDAHRGQGGQMPSAGAVIIAKEMRDDGTIAPRLWCTFNTAGMAVAYASSDSQQSKCMILKQPKPDNSDRAGRVYLTVLPWDPA